MPNPLIESIDTRLLTVGTADCPRRYERHIVETVTAGTLESIFRVNIARFNRCGAVVALRSDFYWAERLVVAILSGPNRSIQQGTSMLEAVAIITTLDQRLQ